MQNIKKEDFLKVARNIKDDINSNLGLYNELAGHLLDTGFLEYPQEEGKVIYEYYLIHSSYIIKDFEKAGATLLECFGCTFWGRETCGQSIFLDGLVNDIIINALANRYNATSDEVCAYIKANGMTVRGFSCNSI